MSGPRKIVSVAPETRFVWNTVPVGSAALSITSTLTRDDDEPIDCVEPASLASMRRMFVRMSEKRSLLVGLDDYRLHAPREQYRRSMPGRLPVVNADVREHFDLGLVPADTGERRDEFLWQGSRGRGIQHDAGPRVTCDAGRSHDALDWYLELHQEDPAGRNRLACRTDILDPHEAVGSRRHQNLLLPALVHLDHCSPGLGVVVQAHMTDVYAFIGNRCDQ